MRSGISKRVSSIGPRIACLLVMGASFAAENQLRSAEPGPLSSEVSPRFRVIVDNDFGGDPDGLFQLAHHLLSPSVDVRAVIASHNYPHGFYGAPGTSAYAAKVASDLLAAMGLAGKVKVLQGSEQPLADLHTAHSSEAAQFIVREAIRTDSELPLFVVCGAGLTDLASAYLINPRIAAHMQLIWIGGPEYEGVSPPPPGKLQVEYNLGIDVHAAQVIFNESNVPIWQVPRDSYRQVLVSYAELEDRLRSDGRLGRFLLGQLKGLVERTHVPFGEAYVLGDSPLVLLTALQSSWDPDPSSSRYITVHAPNVSDSGWYESNPRGRQIRVYTALDTRLVLADLFAKLAASARN